MLTEKPVFITGATGSIGRALAKRLSSMGVQLRLFVREPARAKDLQALPNVELIRGDMGDFDSIRNTMDGYGVVYHTAAKLIGSDHAEFERVNVGGTEALGKEAVRAKVDRFVQVSSVSVYGYPDEQNVREDHGWQHRGSYNATKQQAERVLQALAATDNLPVVFARPSNVVGPNQYVFTVQLIERMKQGLLHVPRKQDSGIHDSIYIENLIDALILLGQHPQAVGGAYNISDGTPQLMHDYLLQLAGWLKRPVMHLPAWFMRGTASLAEGVERLLGRDAEITREAIEFFFFKTTFNTERLRQLGWSPAIDKVEADRRTEQWLREQRHIP